MADDFRIVRSKDVQLWHMYRGQISDHYYVFTERVGEEGVNFYSIRHDRKVATFKRRYRDGVSFNFSHEDPEPEFVMKIVFENDWSGTE